MLSVLAMASWNNRKLQKLLEHTSELREELSQKTTMGRPGEYGSALGLAGEWCTLLGRLNIYS